MRRRKACRSEGAVNVPVVEGYERGGGGDRGRRAQRAARDAGSGGAGVVTQCDVSAPSARYAPAPPSVAARSRPPNVAPYAPPPSAHTLIPGFSFVPR